MDLINRGVGALPQSSQQMQSGSISWQQSTSQQMPQVNNLGMTWNMADMNASYSYADSVLTNKNFNSYSSHGYGTNSAGANAMGFSQAVPGQSSNSLLYGYGANTMGLDETVTSQRSNSYSSVNQSGGNNKNLRQPLLPSPNPANISSNFHLSQFGKGGSGENRSGGSSKNFRQPFLPTPPTSATLDYNQTMANESSDIHSSESSHGYGMNSAGANAMGFSQAMPDQSSNSLLYGCGANTTGLDETVTNQSSNSYSSVNQSGGNNKNFRQPLLPSPNPTNISSNFHLSQFGKGGSGENRSGGSSKNFRQPLLPTPPTNVTSDYHQTMANESSDIPSSELGLGRSRKRARKPRNMGNRESSNPTPNDSSIVPTINFNYSPDTSHEDGRPCPLPGGGHPARFGGNAPNSRQYGGNHSKTEHTKTHRKLSQLDSLPNPYARLSIPVSSQYRGDQPVLDATKFRGNHPVPDGTTSVKYPAPDATNLLFDSSTGYRFDPTTGLHYDANSGFYLNNHLKVLLRWDALTSTYVLVSNNTSGLATPAVALLNKTQSPGTFTAGLSPEDLKALAVELAPLLKSGPQEPGPQLNPDRDDAIRDRMREDRRPVPADRTWDDIRDANSAERTCDDRRDLIPADQMWSGRYDPIPTDRRWDGRSSRIPAERMCYNRPDPSPADRKWGDRRDPVAADRMWDERRDPIPADRIRDERRDPIPADRIRDERRDPIPADHMWDDRCDSIAVCRAWDVRRDMNPSRESRSPVRGTRRSPSWERELSISEIHESNLKDLGNLYGRYFPKNPSPSSFLLVAPVPSKNEMSRQDVTKYLEDVVSSSDKLAFRSIRVYQGGFGAPCNYAMIRFNNDDAALYWYKLHRGIIDLGNYRAAYPTFLFFAEDHWICSKQRDGDKGCDSPTPNFPYRNLCYKCLELRTKLESPIIKMGSPTKWIGISQLDCTKYSSVADVLKRIPSHKGITIESTEFLREPSGLPIGLCVFQILDREQSTRFFEILKNKRFDVSYVHLNKKALDSAPAPSDRSLQRGTEMALSRLGPKLNASLPSRVKPALPARDRLGSTTTTTISRAARKTRRRRERKFKPCVELMENLGQQFLVVDECKESESNEEKKESKPFLKPKPVTHLNQLKDVVSVHTLNSEDPDNVLRELFVRPALKAVLLLAPVPAGPGGDKDLVKKDIENILKNDGVQFNNVGVFQGKGLGAPCNYGLIIFNKPRDALSLYNKHKGFLHLNNGIDDQFKAFMHFSDKNWTCLHCKYVNFPLRSWCNKCLKNRDKRVFSAISVTRTPTNFLGISSVGLPLNMPESSFTTDIILAGLPEEESNRVLSCKMMLEDKGLPGLCVLEAKDSNDCENLLKHFHSTGWRASFLKMNDETSDMYSVKATNTGDASIVARPEQKVRDSQVSSNCYDPMKHIFDNSKPSQCIILSPAPALNWDKLKEQMCNLLEEDGVSNSCSYDACRPEVCGSPHDCIQISFIDLEKAVSWFRKHDGYVELVFPGTSKQKEIKFKMFLYYSENAWRCRACLTVNFPARSLCHKCYAHREEDGFTPVTISKTPTKWVGISGLRQTIYNVEQVKKTLPLLDSFQITQMRLIKEPNPLLHVGLCVIETPNKEDGLNLAVYIQNHQAMNYEKKSKVIFVNFIQQPGKESCKQHPMLDANMTQEESSFPLMNVDDSFSHCKRNDSFENYYLYWQNIIKGVEEGEDMLKEYFQDQFIMPLPAGNSVFAQLPPMRQIVGSTPASEFRKVFVSLLEKSGVDINIAKHSKLYPGKNLGGPCSYTILTFKEASDAEAWRAKHNGKWAIDLEDGSKWVSFLRPCNPNWICKKCDSPNFPLRLHCFSCYESRDGGAPAVTTSDVPTRFVGITRFQNWCATEEILFENIRILEKMRENQQLKDVHYPTELSGISLGLCVLELENIAVAKNVFTHLMAWTQKKHTIVYVEGHWLNSKCKTT